MADNRKGHLQTHVAVARGAVEVTPDDAADQPDVLYGLIADADGAIKVTTKKGNEVVIPVAMGVPIHLHVTRVWATGTNVNVVGLL